MKTKEMRSAPTIILGEILPKELPSSLTDEQILAMQAPSTRAVLTRPKEKDAEAQARVVKPEAAYVNPDAVKSEKFSEAVGTRSFTADEVAIVEDIRHKGRNNQQIPVAVWIDGKEVKGVHLPSISPAKKEKAIDAFSYTPPAPLTEEQKFRLTALTPITEAMSVLPKKEKLSWFQRLFSPKDWFPERLSYLELQERRKAWENEKEKK